jgi:ureidoglycolate lyase
MELIAEPLTASAFAPFGAVLEAPADPGRQYFDEHLMNRRPASRTSLSISRLLPIAQLPLRAELFERHEFSSQTFLPLSASRYLVIVAPAAAAGGPDAARARAFVAQAGQGISYHANIWHHGMTVLDAPAVFSVLMWRDGTSGDEEFVTLPRPLTIHVPSVPKQIVEQSVWDKQATRSSR